jgi:hypothetical protein
MSPAPAPAPADFGELVEKYLADERTHQRFPIKLDVDYKVTYRGRVERQGSGRTVNMASGGVLLDTMEALPLGSQIELVIHWPFLLEGVCPLKLVVKGRVVRSDDRGVAVLTKHHEFRTAGARAATSRLSQDRVRSMAR